MLQSPLGTDIGEHTGRILDDLMQRVEDEAVLEILLLYDDAGEFLSTGNGGEAEKRRLEREAEIRRRRARLIALESELAELEREHGALEEAEERRAIENATTLSMQQIEQQTPRFVPALILAVYERLRATVQRITDRLAVTRPNVRLIFYVTLVVAAVALMAYIFVVPRPKRDLQSEIDRLWRDCVPDLEARARGQFRCL